MPLKTKSLAFRIKIYYCGFFRFEVEIIKPLRLQLIIKLLNVNTYSSCLSKAGNELLPEKLDTPPSCLIWFGKERVIFLTYVIVISPQTSPDQQGNIDNAT